MERLVGVTYPELTEKVPHILMAWYQADILTEEAAKQWGTHVSKKYVDRDTSKRVRKASEPFIKVCPCINYLEIGLLTAVLIVA